VHLVCAKVKPIGCVDPASPSTAYLERLAAAGAHEARRVRDLLGPQPYANARKLIRYSGPTYVPMLLPRMSIVAYPANGASAYAANACFRRVVPTLGSPAELA
jgi:hypothetical protein